MWHNNGFGNNGQFHDNFNQEDYTPSPFLGTGGPLPGQQYFHQHPQLANNMIKFEDNNGECYTNNGFQPELGLYNEGAFMQTQFTPNTQVCIKDACPVFDTVVMCNVHPKSFG
jgi:hypothetical protein